MYTGVAANGRKLLAILEEHAGAAEDEDIGCVGGCCECGANEDKEDDIGPGDLVLLASGGPMMTVVSHDEHEADTVACAYFNFASSRYDQIRVRKEALSKVA